LQQKLRGGAPVIVEQGQLKYPVQLTSLQLLLQVFFALSPPSERSAHSPEQQTGPTCTGKEC